MSSFDDYKKTISSYLTDSKPIIDKHPGDSQKAIQEIVKTPEVYKQLLSVHALFEEIPEFLILKQMQKCADSKTFGDIIEAFKLLSSEHKETIMLSIQVGMSFMGCEYSEGEYSHPAMWDQKLLPYTQ